MPTIRDGRGELHEYDMGTPPANPSGPVIRVVEPSVVRRQEEAAVVDRMAASRARGARRAGFVKGATKAARRWNGQAAAEADASSPAKGPGSRPWAKGQKRTPEQRERMRQAQLARYQARAATTEPEGREAGAPATDADDRGTTGAAPATEVATPPGPIDASEMHEIGNISPPASTPEAGGGSGRRRGPLRVRARPDADRHRPPLRPARWAYRWPPRPPAVDPRHRPGDYAAWLRRRGGVVSLGHFLLAYTVVAAVVLVVGLAWTGGEFLVYLIRLP